MRYISIILTLIASVAVADSSTIGPDGINSKATKFDGSGIDIGQVEPIGRSAKAGYDPANVSASNTKPAGVYYNLASGMDPPYPDGHIEAHALAVAGVMIGDASAGTLYEGVAPKANLHSAGFAANADDQDVAITINRIATLSAGGTDVRAINLSFGRELQQFIEDTNGKSHLPMFIDWSARRHDVLYVVAWGDNFNPDKRAMTDNYNGITVAASAPFDLLDMKYRKFADINSTQGDAVGDRTSIDILAPGESVAFLTGGNQPFTDNGTSLSAPHVTGTVALLQQYAVRQMNASNPRFVSAPPNSPSQRHEVMKAVILNSADKLNGVHGSTKDVVKADGVTKWTDTAAYSSVSVPLDEQLGAGELNAYRAVQQLAPGEYNPGTVPMIGWDYHTIGGGGSHDYLLSQSVGANSYIAVTLAWDRSPQKTGGNNYSYNDTFFPYGDIDSIMDDLDLQIITADGSAVVTGSYSNDMNLEHVFFQFENAGDYKIRVLNNGGPVEPQNYGLAWWYGTAPPLPKGPGDHDGDGDVDAADNVLWRKSPSSFGGDPGGYDEWRANYGNVYSGSGAGTASVPEPTAVYLALVGMLIGGAKRCRACRTPIASAARLQRGLRTTT